MEYKKQRLKAQVWWWTVSGVLKGENIHFSKGMSFVIEAYSHLILFLARIRLF